MAPENKDVADRERILPPNFIWEFIDQHNESGRFGGQVHTRFPPEPNGRLHIGHAKAICINFGTALAYGGTCNLRMDDTNPTKEETHFVEAIQDDIRWLGFEWQEPMFYASDYFDKLYDFAVQLVNKGKAYVCDLTPDEMRTYRGTLKEPGKDSPYRNRSVEENLDLFARMRAGEFEEGLRTLRAKIDMSSPNIAMRDPVIYRVLKQDHHRTGDKWCIYPMYDFTHCISDSLEGITHSLCSLEFENNRPLYDWFLNELELYHPQQIEFARLNLTYTLMSKRRLAQLVDGGHVDSWDDPRMPTLSGMRRSGVPAEAIRNFVADVGVAKSNSLVEMSLFEHHVRQVLNRTSPRVMGVLNPLKVVITNYPEGQTEELEAINNPEDASAGTRPVAFSRELYIEREDFMENPTRRFYRLSPGNEVRLRYAYFITCTEVIKDDNGEVVELRCTYDPATRGGDAPDGRRPKATLHWVSVEHALEAEVRLYDRLFSVENPRQVEEGGSFLDNLNPTSLTVLPTCYLEAGLASAQPGDRVQFERRGYFCVDTNSTPEKLIFNRTVSLRDSWARMQKRNKK